MKAILFVIIALLVGCAHQAKQAPVVHPSTLAAPLPSRPDSVNIDIERWARGAKEQVLARMYEQEQYSGQRCTLRLTLDEAANVLNVNAEGGAPELCQAAIMAVKTARFPPFPSREAYQILHNVPLEFAL